ncbi:MAG: PEP/pyruvate-binding domain-containing protein, partial [Myxococcota bacterium]
MRYALGFHEIDPADVARVGGKGSALAALSRIDGVEVPAGYCVTTDAFDRFLAAAPSLDARLARLAGLAPDDRDDRDEIGAIAATIRRDLEQTPIPDDLAAAITAPLARLEPHERLDSEAAYAVRSSATAEDAPTASFAGQHDSYLNVAGPAAVLDRVRGCWASLYTDRAVAYRLRTGPDHRTVRMAVVVQQLVGPDAAGVLFTAHPVSGDRT